MEACAWVNEWNRERARELYTYTHTRMNSTIDSEVEQETQTQNPHDTVLEWVRVRVRCLLTVSFGRNSTADFCVAFYTAAVRQRQLRLFRMCESVCAWMRCYSILLFNMAFNIQIERKAFGVCLVHETNVSSLNPIFYFFHWRNNESNCSASETFPLPQNFSFFLFFWRNFHVIEAIYCVPLGNTISMRLGQTSKRLCAHNRQSTNNTISFLSSIVQTEILSFFISRKKIWKKVVLRSELEWNRSSHRSDNRPRNMPKWWKVNCRTITRTFWIRWG